MSNLWIDRRKTADIVYERMLELLQSREWKAGERIPSENALCQLFGVSRVTIREATHRLIGRGMLGVRPGDGTYVTEVTAASVLKNAMSLIRLDKKDLERAMEFRLLLEVEAARLAAVRAGQEDCDMLRQVLGEQRKGRHSAQEAALLDQLFHESVAKASGNPMLCAAIEAQHDILAKFTAAVVGRITTDDALLYHWLVLDAIVEHRENDAATAMRTHMEKLAAAVLRR